MKGLDAAEARFADLDRTRRIDAEFFSTRHLQAAALATADLDTVRDVAEVSDGNHFSISEGFADEGVPYYRGQDAAGHVFIEQSSPPFITREAYSADHMKRSHLKRGDVLLSIVGTTGEASLVTSAASATCSCKLAILRPHDISPEYLAIFLRSEFGRGQTERLTRGAVQMGPLLEDMDQLRIARFPALEDRVAAAVKQSRHEFERAKSFAASAERVMAATLRLDKWVPDETLAYTRPASVAFAAGCLDAEYFAPRMAELLSRLGSGGRSIRDAAPQRQEKFARSGGGVFRYIEIGDMRGDGTATSTELPVGEAPSRATWYVRNNDVVTSAVRPRRRLSAIISSDQDGCVASSGLVVLRPQAVPPEVLLTYLRLPVFCELMDMQTSASLYPSISDHDLLALPFPEINPKATSQIVSSVRSAHTATARASALLGQAKHAVEIAIKNSEAAAIAWLTSQGILTCPPVTPPTSSNGSISRTSTISPTS